MDSAALHLTKHHGAGNDFLVLLDRQYQSSVDAASARALCDRHMGVGADGIIVGTPGSDGAALAMALRNADGSPAELSGNGIRCLVQAAVQAGWVEPGEVEVDTAAGRRVVEYRIGEQPGTGYGRVSMGQPELGAEMVLDLPIALRSARAMGIGNPHIVLLLDGPLPDEDFESVGADLSTSVPEGANVEFLWELGRRGELAMRVFERGVGETLACGTGTCAAVAAARSWGIVDDRATVENPGGRLEVELGPQGAVLGGPTVLVATLSVSIETLEALVAAHGSGQGGTARP